MRSLALLLPRLVLDRAPRAIIATAIVLALTEPLLLRRASDATAGFRDGLSVGVASVASAVIPILALLFGISAAWLADGVVSELKRNGSGPLALTRPVSRSGYFLARWLSGFLCMAAAGLVVVLVLNASAHLSGIPVAGLSPVGAVGAVAVSWLWVGSVVLVFSSLLHRGEAFAGAFLLVMPIVLVAILPPGGLPARIASLFPSKTMLDVSRAFLAGEPVIGGHLLRIAVWGSASLSVGLLLAVRREWTTSG
jgi:ABC-type transport system involved in multi-copper enzyme maturation permease subunit